VASVVDLLTGESTALADLQVRAACEAGVANLGATAHAQVTSGSQHELLGQYTDNDFLTLMNHMNHMIHRRGRDMVPFRDMVREGNF
jgi:hypothetical protein